MRRVDILSIMPPMPDLNDLPERLRRAGRTQAELARYIRLDPSSLTKTIKGERQLKADEMLAIEEFLNLPAGGSTNGLDERPRAARPQRVPVYGYAAAGEDAFIFNDGRVLDTIDPPPGIRGVGEIFAVRVIGSSMEPRLFPGEMVIAQHGLPPGREQDCVVEFMDGSGVVKMFAGRRDGRIYCRQLNPDKLVDWPVDQVKALHAVIWRR